MFFAVQTVLMRRILWIFLLAGFTASAQSYKLDTLRNAAASINTFSLLSFTGATATGGAYITGFNQQFDDKGRDMELELARIDLTGKKTSYKKINGFNGGKGYCWTYTFDKAGNVYLSMLYPRKILILNLKDSIYFRDLGNPFINSNALIYSMAPGRDGNMYFGSSSGGTYWSEYDPETKAITKHPAVDSANDYVLSIAGDSDYVYLQIGQRKSINLWSVNKHNDKKQLLFSIPNTTRYNLNIYKEGIYAGFATDTLKGLFKLINGSALAAVVPPNLHAISGLADAAINSTSNPNFYFEPSSSQLYFSFDKKKYDTLTIRNGTQRTDIRRIFTFPGDKENIYYAGDYYGNYYRYNLKEQKAYLLGSTGYNIYSSLAINDSMIYFSGYPSGFIMLWNKNKPWTTQKTINGKLVNAVDANANPKILHFWKSEGSPMAGFHHTFQMLKDSKGNLIGAGDVIRIGHAASIGVFNAAQNKLYGINYEPYSTFKFSGIALWKDLVVYSMKATGAQKPKLYFYDPAKNTMVDSIDAGFDNYGKVFIDQNKLTGIAGNRIYSIALTEKKLLWNYTLTSPVNEAYRLHDGRFVINTAAQLPPQLKQFIPLPVANFYEANNILYAISGKQIIRVNLK